MNQDGGHERVYTIFSSARMRMDEKTKPADLGCKAVRGGCGGGLRGTRGRPGP